MNTDERQEVELSFVELLRVMWSKLAMIVAVAILCGVVAFAAAKIANVGYYRSEFTFYALSNSQEYSSEEVATGYAKMIVTSDYLRYVARQIGFEDDYVKLKRWVSVEKLQDTSVITVSVTMRDRQQAYELATGLAAVLPEYESYVQYGSLTVTAQPEFPSGVCRNSIKWTKWVVVGFSLGFLIMCCYVSACAILGVSAFWEKYTRRFLKITGDS